jgi:translation elongation factor P/translation initiation factor 5A
MDFYDGAVDVLVDSGIVERNGAWYSFTNRETGETVKFQKKNFEEHADKLMEYYAGEGGEIVENDSTETNIEYLNNKED